MLMETSKMTELQREHNSTRKSLKKGDSRVSGMSGVGVGDAWPYLLASSLLGMMSYLSGSEMPPEFEEKNSQNVQIWVYFRGFIPPETQTLV